MQRSIDPTPGPTAATVAAFRSHLQDIDAEAVTDEERIALIEELERLKAATAAAQVHLTVAFNESQGAAYFGQASARDQESRGRRGRADEEELGRESARVVGSQIGLARKESPVRGDQRVTMAIVLKRDLPRTLKALEEGAICEWTAELICKEAAVLDPTQRHELDTRLSGDLKRFSSRQAQRAARRIVADIDAEAVAERMRKARRSRRVTLRPVRDGMAYLSIYAPLADAAGAFTTLKAYAAEVIAGNVEDESAADEDGKPRGLGAVMSDAALRLLSGRAIGERQSVAVQIVMTDRALLGVGDPERPVNEPATIPGFGAVPAAFARELIMCPETAVFYRRLFTSPDGRDLVAMDAKSRIFPKGLRTMILLRDQRCRTPFCDALITQIDHVKPVHSGGTTSLSNGAGLCQRCNLAKEAPGWEAAVRAASATRSRHTIDTTTPSGQRATSDAPPLLGWGWQLPEHLRVDPFGYADPDCDGDESESPAERVFRLSLAA